MDKTIWKFDLKLLDLQPIQMPVGAEILSVQSQCDELKLWAFVNPFNKTTIRYIEIYGTGHRIDYKFKRNFIGTVQMEKHGLVWHVFERIT